MGAGYSGALWNIEASEPQPHCLIPLVGIVDQLNIAAGQVNCSGRVLFGVVTPCVDPGAGSGKGDAPATAAIRLDGFINGVGVAIVTGCTRLAGDIRVVIITIDIGADAIAIVIADPGAGSGRPGAVAVGIELVVDGSVVAIVASVAHLVRDIRVVVITVHVGADTVAVVITDAGAGGGRSGAVTVGVELVVDGGVVAIVASVADVGIKVRAIKLR